ncbi:hypothetical protein B0I32_13743 [Nonomuraea fuscirosea]|uniref:Uncharacterized protein n=2 Tax=Nonomuraea fuscirosea TaxID=1291556 RepID=A0A2T0M206_9ACTN|nr:hypothetical protein B0I32_13743 [Nonomuraea fuscirosea]
MRGLAAAVRRGAIGLVVLAMACEAGRPSAPPRTTDRAGTPITAHEFGTRLPGMPTPRAGGWRYVYVGTQPLKLSDVVATGPENVWAIGWHKGTVNLLTYDGRGWRSVASPLPPTRSNEDVLLGASGPRDVWLLHTGANGTMVFRWDGQQWRAGVGLAFPVLSVKVVSAKDVWAVGGRLIWHWDGQRWDGSPLPATANHDVPVSDPQVLTGRQEPMTDDSPLPATASALDVSGSSVWAVGFRENGPGIAGEQLTQPAAMRWNGRSWRTTKTPIYTYPTTPPEAGASLDKVVAVDEDHAWALGEYSWNHGEGGWEPKEPPPYLLHWDGRAWTERKSAALRPYCCDHLIGDGAGGVVIGGDTLDDTWHVTSSGVTTRIPRMRASPDTYAGIRALAHIPGTRTIMAIGTLKIADQDHPAIAIREPAPPGED